MSGAALSVATIRVSAEHSSPARLGRACDRKSQRQWPKPRSSSRHAHVASGRFARPYRIDGHKEGPRSPTVRSLHRSLDGRRVLSCLTLAVMTDGLHVTTIEGFAGPNGELQPVQQAFVDFDAFQCGYWTPGQPPVSSAAVGAVTEATPSPVSALAGGASSICPLICPEQPRAWGCWWLWRP
jgi:hypothetical protein